MSDHEASGSTGKGDPQWEFPDAMGHEPTKPAGSFSLRRVVTTVSLSMLVIAPTLYLLGYHGYLGESGRSEPFPQGTVPQGSGRRIDSAFDVKNASIPREEILSGGPPKDGIPAISNPKMLSAAEATYLDPSDRVVGVVDGEDARAYPLAILNYHEIVNDRVSDRPIAVSFCPLCDSVSVFDRNTPSGEYEFGVSGLLYNSNVLMYDRAGDRESLWSQLKNESIAGPQVGQPLKLLPVELTSWQQWQLRYPSTKVMSTATGFRRDYQRTPYTRYFETDELMFPVDKSSDRLPNKARVLGVLAGGESRAYPRSSFDEQHTRLEDEIEGKRIVVEFNPESESLRIAEADDGVTWMYSFWFSWYAMHPETDVYSKK